MNSKVLVVDDEPANLQLLKAVLSSMTNCVVGAENGEQAIDILAQEDFDLIIVDYIMVDKTGVDVVLAVAEKSKYPKIIMITGAIFECQDEINKRIAKGHPILDKILLLGKPFELKSLRDAIES